MKTHSQSVTAFILHSQAYQESSLILQVFSFEFGRHSVIAKGVKNRSSQARKAKLQPFCLLQIELIGNRELKTVTNCEPVDGSHYLAQKYSPKALACAYYSSELLMRALPEQQEFAEIFMAYQSLLIQLGDSIEYARLLRQFELVLLRGIGVAPDFQFDSLNQPIDASHHYNLQADSGFSLVAINGDSHSHSQVYSGECILAINLGEISSDNLAQAKMLTRFLLREVIGNRPLQSRKLWQHIQQTQPLEKNS